MYLQLLLIVVIIVSANLISNVVYTRFDLTSEKRYTLSPETMEILKTLMTLCISRFISKVNFRPVLSV